MNTSGQIRTALPAALLVSGLRNGEILAKLMPPGCTISRTGPDAFAFVMKRKFGPVELALPGTILIVSQGAQHQMTFHGAHLLFGKADMALSITLSEANKLTVLEYTGTLQASGLAGRLLSRVKEKTVNERVHKGFVSFKTHVTAARETGALVA